MPATNVATDQSTSPVCPHECKVSPYALRGAAPTPDRSGGATLRLSEYKAGYASQTENSSIMLLRRTAGLLTSLLLLQSALAAAVGAGCTPGTEGPHATSSAMHHATMRGASIAALVHFTASSVLAEKMHDSASDSEAATCVRMNSCTSSSEVAVAYLATPLKPSTPPHIVLFASAPGSRATTPDVPPPRT